MKAAELTAPMTVDRQLHLGDHVEPAVVASTHRIGDTIIVTWTVGFDSYYRADEDVPVVAEVVR